MTLFVMIFAPAGRHIWYRHIARLGMACLVWARFGMECIPAGHILYLRPSISRLSTSSLPPSSSCSSTSTSWTPNHPDVYLSISSSHCWIHFCQERIEEVLTGNVFQFWTFCRVLLQRVSIFHGWILWSRSGFAHLTTLLYIGPDTDMWHLPFICKTTAQQVAFKDMFPFSNHLQICPCPVWPPIILAKFWKNFIMVMLSQ